VTASGSEDKTADETSEAVELTEASVATDVADAAAENVDDNENATTPTAPPAARVDRRLTGALRRNLGAIAVALLLIVSAGVAAGLYFYQYRPDQQTNAAAANVALEAAKNGTVALLSYSPETLDTDFANAKANLTGEFLKYYTQFTEQIVTPAAKEKQVKTTASVVRAAVADIQPDTAEVLVFVNQVTTSKENPDGAFAASSVKVGLKRVDGRWMIDAFDPV
jgi:Mce-associated membrane protein